MDRSETTGAKKTKRLFYALWLDDDTRQQIVSLRKHLPAYKGRDVHPLDLHVTLQYLGQVPEEDYDCVVAAPDKLELNSFDLDLLQLGYWPRPKVLWLGPEEIPEQLSVLAAQLGRALRKCGYPPEKRPYHPHLTLARKVRGRIASHQPESLIWQVDTLALVESLTAQDPPRYRPIKSWHLQK